MKCQGGGGSSLQCEQDSQCRPYTRMVTQEQLEGGERAVCEYLGREFPAEGTASAKALRRKCAWNVLSTARWPVCLKKSKREYE